MKKLYYILPILILMTAYSCDSDDQDPDVDSSTLQGTWEIRTILADPGDGSGTFQVDNTGKRLVFDGNGTVSSNFGMCFGASSSSSDRTGSYNEMDNTIMASAGNCQATYTLADGTLQINYFCIEACSERYAKIAD